MCTILFIGAKRSVYLGCGIGPKWSSTTTVLTSSFRSILGDLPFFHTGFKAVSGLALSILGTRNLKERHRTKRNERRNTKAERKIKKDEETPEVQEKVIRREKSGRGQEKSKKRNMKKEHGKPNCKRRRKRGGRWVGYLSGRHLYDDSNGPDGVSSLVECKVTVSKNPTLYGYTVRP